MSLYTIGIDYGTESGRAVLVDVSNGRELAVHVTPYAHGVIDERLPGSDRLLGTDWALQNPVDYFDVLRASRSSWIENLIWKVRRELLAGRFRMAYGLQ